MKIIAPPGVFRPHADTVMLADLVAGEAGPGKRVLDICTGSGAIAIAAARAGAEASAIDVSRRALATTRLNAVRNGVRVRTLRGNLFEPVGGERFDVIASNPPYLPSVGDVLPRRGPARAWEGGRDGRVLLDRIIAQAGRHLLPGGVVMVVHSSVCGIGVTLDGFAAAGLSASVVQRRTGPLGPLLRRRAELLESRGLVQAGVREEELVVISARLSPAEDRPLVRSPT